MREVRNVAKDKAISQRHISKSLGLSSQTLSNYFLFKSYPALNTLIDICEVVGMELNVKELGNGI